MVIQIIGPGFYVASRSLAVSLGIGFPDDAASALCDFFDVTFVAGVVSAVLLARLWRLVRDLVRMIRALPQEGC